MALSGTIFVDRGNSAKARRSLQEAGDGMKARKSSLWMYPEGTRNNQPEPNVLPLKKGGFHLAIQAGLPIVPVVSENYWRLYHKGVFESGVIKMKGRVSG
jgi:lysophosphatidate acyltransferase